LIVNDGNSTACQAEGDSAKVIGAISTLASSEAANAFPVLNLQEGLEHRIHDSIVYKAVPSDTSIHAHS
jgi:hypothetical protein